MPLVPFSAGQRMTASVLNDAFDTTRIVHGGADQIINNTTTFASSVSLSLSVEADTRYVYDLMLMFKADTAADFKWQFDAPSGTFIRRTAGLATPASNTSQQSAVFITTEDFNGFACAALGTGVSTYVNPSGLLIIGSTAGDITVQFAQDTTHASNCILQGGSYFRLTKVT